MTGNKKELLFTKDLLKWHTTLNTRAMPWKGEKDPYKIWLSEIILQQTRVEQGLQYYNNFIKKYPSIKKLAAAPDQEIFKLWEGLGYYTRCKNLIATAKYISKELDGKFPDDYEQILKLKGIGPYTAAAIASFAFNKPYAVVDGNVNRVLARYFGIATPIDSSNGKKIFTNLASKLLDKKRPDLYNQAIMDLGAVICKPKLPLCDQCILKKNCLAFAKNAINNYPVKEKKFVKTERWFYYVIAEYREKIFFKKRSEKDIWQNLHEFYLIEREKEMLIDEIVKSADFKKISGKEFMVVDVSKLYKQQLTHQTIRGFFMHIKVKKKPELDVYELIDKKELRKSAFPVFITGYFKDAKDTGLRG